MTDTHILIRLTAYMPIIMHVYTKSLQGHLKDHRSELVAEPEIQKNTINCAHGLMLKKGLRSKCQAREPEPHKKQNTEIRATQIFKLIDIRFCISYFQHYAVKFPLEIPISAHNQCLHSSDEHWILMNSVITQVKKNIPVTPQG